MLIETVTTIAAAGLAGYSYLLVRGGPSTSDTDKIQMIFKNAGWQGRGGETTKQAVIHTNFRCDFDFRRTLNLNRDEGQRIFAHS